MSDEVIKPEEAESGTESGTESGAEAEAGQAGQADPQAQAAAGGAAPVQPLRPRRRFRLLRRIMLVFGTLTGVAGIVIAAAILWLVDRPVVAPDWMRDRIEARIDASLSGMDLDFREMVITVGAGWRPSLLLRDLALSEQGGGTLLTLTRLEASIAARPLLDGHVQPGRIALSGANAILRRDRDGSFKLAFGEAIRPVGEGANIAQLIERVDDILVRPQFAALREVRLDALTIRYEDARAGRAWSADGGRAVLQRVGDDLTLRGDVALLGGFDYATVLEMNYDSRIGDATARFGVTFEEISAPDIAAQVPPLAWLDVLRAPISGALRSSVGGDGRLGALSGTLQIGAGVLQPNETTRPIPFDGARSYFTYDPDKQEVRFDELSVQSKWVSNRAEGRAILKGMENGFPTAMLGQFTISDIVANPAGLYPEPVHLERAVMEAQLKLNPFSFELGQLAVTDQGQVLHFDGQLDATDKGWKLALDGRAGRVNADRVRTLWPERAAPKTRGWLAKNLHAADLSNVEFALRLEPEQRPDTYLGFEFDKGEVTFLKTLPDITEARGRGSLLRDRFVVTLAQGWVDAPLGGRVDVTGTSFIVPDVKQKNGTPAQVDIRAKSTVTAGLSLLDMEPFKYLSKAGQPVTLADGLADVTATLNLPLKDKVAPKEVKFTARAALSALRSDKLIAGRVLTAPSALAEADNAGLRISGTGAIGQVPFTGSWQTAFQDNPQGRSRVAGNVELSPAFIEEFAIGLPKGSVTGATQGKVSIDLQKNRPPEFALSSNLNGVALRLDAIGWSMSRGATGTFKVAGVLASPPRIETLSLNAPGLRAQGRVSLTDAGQLDRATFSRVQAGSWLDAPVTLRGRGNAAPAVEVSGGRIDLRQTSVGAGTGNGGTGSSSDSGPITLALERLQISEGIALTGFRGDFTNNGGMGGKFSGQVNGGPRVSGTVVPDAGRSAFRITSDKGGEVLAAAGLLEKAHRGEMELVLRPRGAVGEYNGVLRMTNVWLRDAPAMAGLLSAVSIIGLLEQLSGDGLLFTDVEAKFRMTPKQVIVTESSATGASMGISMDGYYDLASDRMDMQGVFSPLYLINGIGAVLTRKGEGLIGFNYTLRGTAEKPRVQVNPLSIFTPGMFREIFRRPAPKLNSSDPGARGGQGNTTPATQAPRQGREGR